MSDQLRFTILGCGSSPGTPRIGGDWGQCDPTNPRNRRRRCSLLVQRVASSGATTDVLIDTSPDLREQAIDAGLRAIDGVLFTHPHADHLHGIDDLRGFVINMRRRVDVYADDQTMARLLEGFRYCFETPPGSEYPPIVTAHHIQAEVPVSINGAAGAVTALPLDFAHGRISALGFRIGSVAYSPDVSDISARAESRLQGLDIWILDALRQKPHPTHFSLAEALGWIERLKPKRAILTHMNVDLDYAALRAVLPAHVEPAYDGMVVQTTMDGM